MYILTVVLFQSLLFWISHFDTARVAIAIEKIGFQSLLFWISHFDNLKLTAQGPDFVSILVVLD